MKKYLFVLLLLFVPCVAFASDDYFLNYYGVEITNDEYSNLLELGFTEDEIYYLSEEEFNNNKDIIGSLESTTVRYFANIVRYDVTGRIISNADMEITEEDYNAESVMPLSDGYVETTYKQMRTTIAKASSKYRYKVTLTWKQMPSTRSYDIIGIGIQSALVYINSSLVFNQTYCVSSNCTNSSSYNSSNTSSTGAGVSFKLPTSTSITSLRSYFYFDVSKDTSNTITAMYAFGDYSHATKTISSSNAQGFYVDQSGIVLSSSISSYYDTISTADAFWTGSW